MIVKPRVLIFVCAFAVAAGAVWMSQISFGQARSSRPQAPAAPKAVRIEDPNSLGKNLLPNGDFNTPSKDGTHPAHWQHIDNLVFFWTTDPKQPKRGKVIKIDTDVYQHQAYQWWIERFVHREPLKKAPKKLPTSGPKYNTIAGLDGGFFWSDFIEIKKGGAYKVCVDAKGSPAYVFIRGYEKKLPVTFADECPAVQEQFRRARGEPLKDAKGRPIKYRLRYLYTTKFSVGGSKQWKTYTHIKPRHPNNREITENVRYIRICIYPYWPPGEYWFDNVRVFEITPDPNQPKP